MVCVCGGGGGEESPIWSGSESVVHCALEPPPPYPLVSAAAILSSVGQ